MKNGDKFKTAEERIAKFNKVCGLCEKVDCNRFYALECFNAWLDDEAKDEKPLPCPFCGSVIAVHTVGNYRKKAQVQCTCGYRGAWYDDNETAIAEHNRVAKAMMEDAKKEGETR